MIDINPNYLQDETQLSDTLSGSLAITNGALFSILNTTPGEQANIFQADVGSFWRTYLQEPISDTTAAKIQLEILDSIEKWLPTITLNRAASHVAADFKLPGYRVFIHYTSPDVTGIQSVNWEIVL
jgi:phage baseplate assembly protein W